MASSVDCLYIIMHFKMLTIDVKLFIRYVRRADFTTFMCRLSGSLGASTYRNPMCLTRSEQGFLYLCCVKLQMIIPILNLKILCIPKFSDISEAFIFILRCIFSLSNEGDSVYS